MQQLEGRNTYTPTCIPHTRSNCGLALNREEPLRVSGLKTLSNISDAALTVNLIRRAGLASSRYCYQSAIELRTRQPIQLSATNYIFGRGTLFPVLKYGVSATPAPHG